MNPKIKIIIGILLISLGIFGARLTCLGIDELGALDNLKLDAPIIKK